ncbi:quinon protein alcohol dehydrogenase-like superfamily [Chytridium lagenaria]|nr:quinon protein alcohol dehydrogenase-like superfamily [Chytridium lagenaria]
MSLSERFIVYGSDDTHTIFTRYLTDQLVVRDLQTMKVSQVMGGFKLRNVCVCGDFIVTDDGSSDLRVTRITNEVVKPAEREAKVALLHPPHISPQPLIPTPLIDDVVSPDPVAMLHIGDDMTVGLICDPLNKHVISASASGNMCIWDMQSFSLVGRFTERPNISSIGLSGPLLITAGGGIDDQFIHCWDLPRRSRFRMLSINYHTIFLYAKLLRITPPKPSHLWSVDALAVSNRTIACNFGYQGTYLVFERFRLKWIVNDHIEGSLGGLNTPKVCLTDRFLFTAADTRSSIAMWDLKTGHLLRRLKLVTSITSINVTPDGTRLIVSAFGGTLYEWKVIYDEEGEKDTSTYDDLLKVSREALDGVMGERMKKRFVRRWEGNRGW